MFTIMVRRTAYLLGSILFLLALPAGAETACLSLDAVPALVCSARTIVLGELHGTTQGPAFAAALACALSRAGTPVLLGVEVLASEQAAIDNYLSGGSERGFYSAAQASSFWVREKHDGRASTAMLALLRRIRDLRAHGAKVEVVTFDPVPSQYRPGDTRDRLMAENLRAARAAQNPEAVKAAA